MKQNNAGTMMRPLLQSAIGLTFVLCLAAAAVAQDSHPANEQGSDLTITAFVAGERVRFTSPSSVMQIRLEVYSPAGRKVFDNELRGGNVLDWHLQDGQAEPIPDDTYLCVITVKRLSGRISQRIGSVTLEKGSTTVQSVDASQMTAQQSQAIGPIEENASLTVLKEDDNRTPTIIAHNGAEGQITRGRGALSFRIGDFFSGRDTEQMRLTPDGNLGIGITHPQTRLDVDGLIRASQGIMFPDGTIQKTAAIAGGVSQGNGGQSQTGQGPKPGKLSKASGRTGDGNSTVSPEFLVSEDLTVNGSIFFTAGSPRDIAMLNNTGGIRIYSAPSLTGTPASAAIQFFGTDSAFTGQAYIDSGAHNNAAVIFRTAGTGGTLTERMRITATGNVGVGTANPLRMLQLGSNTDALFTFEPMDTSPNAGYIRFGDNTGWKLHIGRNRECSQINCPTLNSGTQGVLMTIEDKGNVGIGTASPTAKLDVSGAGPSTIALRISNGAIQVSGAGVGATTPVFIHRASKESIFCFANGCPLTEIDHPLTNNDPFAILIITQNFEPAVMIDPHPTMVFYDFNRNRWGILNTDNADMVAGAAFNVLVVKR